MTPAELQQFRQRRAVMLTIFFLLVLYQAPLIGIVIEYIRTVKFSGESVFISGLASDNSVAGTIDLIHRFLIATLSGFAVFAFSDKFTSSKTIFMILLLLVGLAVGVWLVLILSAREVIDNLGGIPLSPEPLKEIVQRIINGQLTFLGVILGISITNSATSASKNTAGAS